MIETTPRSTGEDDDVKIYIPPEKTGSKILQIATAVVGEGRPSHETERSSRWRFGQARSCQLSRVQVAGDLVVVGGMPEADTSCQDAFLVLTEQKIFGVFDGVGGESGGREAASLASKTVSELALDPSQEIEHPDRMLNIARLRIIDDASAGRTTAALVKITEQKNCSKLLYASIGDSRIYIVNQEGKACQITKDEGEGRNLARALGDKNCFVEQYGEMALMEGDRIVLCTDGVTGDYGDDIMEPEELGSIVHGAKSADEAVRALMTTARKKDDRTAIVIFPGSQ